MDDTKRQDLPPGLWVVATPIGNLSDLAPRARQALEEADAVLCEDTRQTQKLLAALGIASGMKRLERVDAHAGEGKIEALVRRLENGESLALVTDAGTPGISDPGAALTLRAREQGIRVTPFPGPSAVMALLSIAGVEETFFTFRGFFPRKSTEREEELKRVGGASEVSRVYVWFESPQRVSDALQSLVHAFSDAYVVAAKELTKLHEKSFSGTAAEVAERVHQEIELEGERGEWCFLVKLPVAKGPDFKASEAESSDWVKTLHCLKEAEIPASEASKLVSQHFGVPKKTVYESALKIYGKKF